MAFQEGFNPFGGINKSNGSGSDSGGGDSGGAGDSIKLVTVTYDEEYNPLADATYDDIVDAINNGKVVILYDGGIRNYFLYDVQSDAVLFSSLRCDIFSDDTISSMYIDIIKFKASGIELITYYHQFGGGNPA